MEEALRQLCADVEAAVEKGTEIVVLSDRGSMDAERPPIPTLLAVGAVHHHLIKWGPRLMLKLGKWIYGSSCGSLNRLSCPPFL